MRVEEFSQIVSKVTSFKFKLDAEHVPTVIQDSILKIYISELTSRINTKHLRRVC